MTSRSIALGADDAARTYQLAVIALCVLALLVAAIALPPVEGLPPAGESSGEGSGGNGGGDGADGGGNIVIEPGNGTGTPVGPLEPANGSLDRECAVYLLDRPVPGSVVPVLVLQNGSRNAGVPVRFNGRLVGETDDRGLVTGEVPYQRELAVSVDVPGNVECAFVDHEGRVSESTLSAGLAASTLVAGQAGSQDQIGGAGTDERGNYTVDGAVQIGVRGEPYPGDRVDVVAAIDGVPMSDAAVAIDGEEVARTGPMGRATVTVPSDGRETVTVRVSRGDFAGERRVDLLVLRVGISPDAPLALPGGGARAVATIDGEPVDGASVTVDGEPVGRTDAEGAVSFTLPADPTATLVVEGRDQRASTTMWPVYVPTIAAGFLYLGSLAVAYRRDGTRGVVGVLAATAVVAGTVLVLYGLVRDRTEVAVAGGILAVAGAGVLFWQRAHWRTATREGAGDLGHYFAGVVAAAARLAYEAALALERFVLWAGARLRGLVERLRSAPRSIRGLAAVLAAWLAALPGRLAALARWIAGTPWRLLAWWRERGGGEPRAAEPEPTDPAAVPVDEGDAPFSLREAWRRFARWVLPGPWRHRTPGEVARAAISEGFPGQSVGELTDVFRDVEYGERPLTEERRERAKEAFESLQGHRRDEEAGD